ncbi:MAG TPA: hypothetical protein VHS28_01545 [Chloroflexota bacterium]|nr:hypothetical protein [Chloroflexota bacterium]
MKRWSFNIMSGLSLLLCLVTLVLWVHAALGYHWTLRFAAKDGRLWAVRDHVFERGKVLFLSAGPWPHRRVFDCFTYGPTFPAGHTTISLKGLPLLVRRPWWHLGLVLEHGQKEVVLSCTDPVTQQEQREVSPQPVWHWMLSLPYWIPTSLLALPTLLQIARRLRNRRHRPGCCPTCDYDLRATPERCPECGTPIAAFQIEALGHKQP